MAWKRLQCSHRKCLDAMVISEKLLEVNGRFSNMNEKALTYVRWRHAIYAMRYLETLYTETRHLDRKLISATLKKVVPKGTLMATIRNPLTLEVIEQMFAPCEETVFLMLRGMMGAVNPGGYAYILGERKTAKVFENE